MPKNPMIGVICCLYDITRIKSIVHKEDLNASPAEMVYGSTLRIPGEFFVENKSNITESEFIKDFRGNMSKIRPTS